MLAGQRRRRRGVLILMLLHDGGVLLLLLLRGAVYLLLPLLVPPRHLFVLPLGVSRRLLGPRRGAVNEVGGVLMLRRVRIWRPTPRRRSARRRPKNTRNPPTGRTTTSSTQRHNPIQRHPRRRAFDAAASIRIGGLTLAMVVVVPRTFDAADAVFDDKIIVVLLFPRSKIAHQRVLTALLFNKINADVRPPVDAGIPPY